MANVVLQILLPIGLIAGGILALDLLADYSITGLLGRPVSAVRAGASGVGGGLKNVVSMASGALGGGIKNLGSTAKRGAMSAFGYVGWTVVIGGTIGFVAGFHGIAPIDAFLTQLGVIA